MERVLRRTLCLDGQTFDPIAQPTTGGDWETRRRRFDVADAAALVVNPAQFVGIRPRWRTRVVVLDIDAHADALSPYWHPDGPSASPAVQRLLHEAEQAGCRCPIYRTPSGGWHVWIALPEAQPVAFAHTIGRALVAAAGIALGSSRAELFPNTAEWDPTPDPRKRKAQNGIRLPGQAHCALWTGAGWESEPELAWRELAAAIDAADAAAPGWAALQQAAGVELQRIQRERHRPRFTRKIGSPRRPGALPAWTGPGQSNDNLGRLANALWSPGITPAALAEAMAAAAPTCAGFSDWASADTKRRLPSWCRDWAAACVRRPPAGRRRAAGDPDRNARLHREAVARWSLAGLRLAHRYGAKVLTFSERRLQRLVGGSRTTIRKHGKLLKRVFDDAVQAVLSRLPRGGTHPAPRLGVLPAVPLSADHLISSSGPGDAPLRSQPPPPHPPPEVHPVALPTKPPPRLDQRRQREREELARWLGLAAA